MSILDIVTVPDPILKKKSAPVERLDDELRRLAEDMLETMYDAPGIGLAGVQVGVLRQILVADVADPDAETGERVAAPFVLINPEILTRSEAMSTYNEGCLSIPGHYAEIDRPATVRIGYLGLDGARHEVEADGLLATCLQHEIDHLHGRLFIDYLSRLKREMIVKKVVKAQREDATVL